MSQWCWRCVNLGPNKRFGTDYVIIATNERGVSHKVTFSHSPDVTPDDDMVWSIRSLVRLVERSIRNDAF